MPQRARNLRTSTTSLAANGHTFPSRRTISASTSADYKPVDTSSSSLLM